MPFSSNMVNLVCAFFYIELLNFYKDNFLSVFPLDSFCQVSKIMLLNFDKNSITSKTYFFSEESNLYRIAFLFRNVVYDYICHFLLFSKILCVIPAVVIVVFQICIFTVSVSQAFIIFIANMNSFLLLYFLFFVCL